MKTKNYIWILFMVWVPDLFAQMPDWSVKAVDFSNSMTVVGVVRIDGTEFVDPSDQVAAFVGNEIRGVATLDYQEALDRYLAFLIIYGNEEEEAIVFKAYDSSESQIHDLANMITFKTNDVIGDAAKPLSLSEVALADEASLLSFDIPGSVGTPVVGEDQVLISVFEDEDLGALSATFETSQGAAVFVGDIRQKSGETVNDFSHSVVYDVWSEDLTKHTTYTVIVDDNVVLSSNIGESKSGFVLFPNPAINELNIQLKKNDSLVSVEIIGSDGRKYGTGLVSEAKKEVTLDVSGFVDGAYHVKVVTDHGVFMKQFLVK